MRTRNPISAYTLVELLLALCGAAFITLAAFKLVTSSSRPLQFMAQKNTFNLAAGQAQTIIEQDLRNALAVDTALCQCPNPPTGTCVLAPGCQPDFIRASITPLIDHDVDGPATGYSSIRIVVPDESLNRVKLAQPLTDTHTPIIINASEAVDFTPGGFAIVEDGKYAEVFQITNADVKTSGRLEHGTSPWNYAWSSSTDPSLSNTYSTFATVRPVNVITIGLKRTSGGLQLVRKSETQGDQASILCTNLTEFGINYLSRTAQALGTAPSSEKWNDIAKISFTLRNSVAVSFDNRQAGSEAKKHEMPEVVFLAALQNRSLEIH